MTIPSSIHHKKNNFNLIRLIAAILVFVHHSFPIFLNREMEFDPIRFLFGNSMGAFAVYVFFFISGFLILQSFDTNTKINFIKARFLRIYPAYFIVILFTVFIVVPIANIHSNSIFIPFSSSVKYFIKLNPFNTNGNIHGLFQLNFLSNQINNSIWTIPFEIFCYMILFTLGILKFFKYKHTTLVLWILVLIIQHYNLFEISKLVIPFFNISCYAFIDFLLFFITGMLFYNYRNSVPMNVYLFVSVWIVLFLLKSTELFEICRYVLVGYIFYFIANYKEFSWYNTKMKEDYSYGFYLYAFPIQQLICTYYLQKLIPLSIAIIASFIITLIFAVLSWHLIEKPSLRLKNK